jgi:hypothetical protein
MEFSTIKKDLIDFVSQEKYYQEQELVRVVNNNISYSYHEKIERISDVLGEIALTNKKMELINEYFKNVGDENEEGGMSDGAV